MRHSFPEQSQKPLCVKRSEMWGKLQLNKIWKAIKRIWGDSYDRCCVVILWCIFFIFAFPSAVKAAVNESRGKSGVCRARGRTSVARSLFTLAGIDAFIPNGLSVRHRRFCTVLKTHCCASSVEQCQKCQRHGFTRHAPVLLAVEL